MEPSEVKVEIDFAEDVLLALEGKECIQNIVGGKKSKCPVFTGLKPEPVVDRPDGCYSSVVVKQEMDCTMSFISEAGTTKVGGFPRMTSNNSSNSSDHPIKYARKYNLLDAVDPDDSDFGGESTDEENGASNDGEDPELNCSSLSEEEELELEQQQLASSKSRQKSTYVWTRDTFEPPDTTFRGRMLKIPDEYILPSPIHFFRAFLTSDMLDLLVDMTNQYCVEKTGKSANTNQKEVEQVLGMFLRMGLAKMPGIRCYWETDIRYGPVAGVMGRNRFQQLLTVFHFVDNSFVLDDEKKDKLWKIRPWLEKFRRNCLTVLPEEQNSIGEMIIPFKGKFSKLKQYVKGRCKPWGIRMWARASANGIVSDFEVYQGKREGKQKSLLGVGADVVLKLSDSLPKNVVGEAPLNYKITADNFFTGMPLLAEMQKRGFHYTGTVRENRIRGVKLQSEKQMQRRGKGATDYSIEQSTNVVAVRWYETKTVTTLSTHCGVEPLNTVRCYDKAKRSHVHVQQPSVVRVYKENVRGVNLHECYVAKHTYHIKSRRWYMYIFWHTIRMMVVNGWLSYCRVCKLLGMPSREVLSQRHFQAKVATVLIEQHVGKKPGQPSQELTTPRPSKRARQSMPERESRADGYFHFPLKMENRERCMFCKMKTNNICEKCNVHLCFTEQRNCFRQFHLV